MTQPATAQVITYRDPAELRLHPLQKVLGDPDKASGEWYSFVDGLAAAGPEGIPPLFITKLGFVMDGGRRWRAARQLQWTQVPCLERPETDAGAMIVDSLFGQRNMTRGAKAYLALGLLDEFVKSAEHRRLENLKRGQKSTQKPLNFPKQSYFTSEAADLADLCSRWGISRQTLWQAHSVRELFHDPKCKALAELYRDGKKAVPAADKLSALQKQLREEFEPQLVNGEKNLWNVSSAVGGRITTEDTPRADLQLEFVFKKELGKLTERIADDLAAARKGLRTYINSIEDAAELKNLLSLSELLEHEVNLRTQHLKAK